MSTIFSRKIAAVACGVAVINVDVHAKADLEKHAPTTSAEEMGGGLTMLELQPRKVLNKFEVSSNGTHS